MVPQFGVHESDSRKARSFSTLFKTTIITSSTSLKYLDIIYMVVLKKLDYCSSKP